MNDESVNREPATVDKIVIKSVDRLNEWLIDHGYFEEGYCLVARPTADDYPPECAEYLDPPEVVEVEVGHQVGGGWMAGDVRVIEAFALTAHQVRQWTPDHETDPYMHGGIKVNEADGQIVLDLSRHGRIVCGWLSIEPVPARSIPVQPYDDPSSVSVRVAAGTPPNPADWLEWFRRAGENVAWRVYGGDTEWPVEQMQANEYAGFLQRLGDIPTTRSGVWVEVTRPAEGTGFGLHLSGGERGAAASEDGLWRIARESLIHFSDAQFRTGNCLLTAEQWDTYVRTGVLPDYTTPTPA